MRFISATTRRLAVSFWLPLLGLGLAIVVFYSMQLGKSEESKVSDNNVISMLSAISDIRLRRDTKLDCFEFVYKYLGRSDQLKYYLDLFATSGIKPGVHKRNRESYVTFSFDRPILANVPNSRFGARDVVVVLFIIDGYDLESGVINSCSGVLKAAPDYL